MPTETQTPTADNNEPCCSSIRDGGKEHSYRCRNHTYRRELKPCPFCGGDAAITPPVSTGDDWIVRCMKSASCCVITTKATSIDEVRVRWNQRSDPTTEPEPDQVNTGRKPWRDYSTHPSDLPRLSNNLP